MNVSSRLFRLWLLATMIWVACACALALQNVKIAIQESYQYVATLRDGANAPSGETGPSMFASVGYQLAYLDEHVKTGTQIRASFPDGSGLYLDASLTPPDRDLLARAFWEQRWSRWWSASWRWIAGALLPPVLLLALGRSLLWVAAGFRQ